MDSSKNETRRLGRGLASLIPMAKADPAPEGANASESAVRTVPITDIIPNTFQPRTDFDHDALEELANSIRVHGILQPIMVRPQGKRFELIAGERRFRAATIAGITDIPVIVRETSDEDSLAIALIENIQREDLNAIEAARGYRQLLNQFDLTQTELAKQLGKAQPTISNALRLLKLSDEIQNSIFTGQISEEHGKALLTVSDERRRHALWQQIVTDGLSMVEARRRALAVNDPAAATTAPIKRTHHARDVHWDYLEDRLRSALGLRVSIKPGADGSGTVQIDFSDSEDLDGFLEKLHII